MNGPSRGSATTGVPTRRHLSRAIIAAALTAAAVVPFCWAGTASDLQGGDRQGALSVTEVTFQDGETTLAGTLIRPGAQESVGAVVILGGAERGPRTPYKEKTARLFAAADLAALYYDSPGSGGSGGDARLQTKDDRVREAMAAVRFLRRTPGIAPDGVGVWGLSEGGSIALLTTAMDPTVAFTVSISGALGIAPLEITRFRIEMSGHELGLPDGDIERALTLEEVLFELMSGAHMAEWRLLRMKTADWGAGWRLLLDTVEKRDEAQTSEERGRFRSALQDALEGMRAEPWFRLAVPSPEALSGLLAMGPEDLFSYLRNGPFAQGDWNDHLRAEQDLRTIHGPILAIWGDLDHFLPPHRSAATLAHLLRGTGGDHAFEIIAGATHQMTVPGRAELAAGYVGLLDDWLRTRLPGVHHGATAAQRGPFTEIGDPPTGPGGTDREYR